MCFFNFIMFVINSIDLKSIGNVFLLISTVGFDTTNCQHLFQLNLIAEKILRMRCISFIMFIC
jgi:hypothetical protein